MLDQHGMSLDQVHPAYSSMDTNPLRLAMSPKAMAILRSHLPKHAILVGQNIRKDVEWLQVKAGLS